MRPGTYLFSRLEAVSGGEALHLRHPSREVWVRVEVLAKDEKVIAEFERQLVEGIQRMRGVSEISVASPHPPLMPGPGLIAPPTQMTPQGQLRILPISLLGIAMLVANIFIALYSSGLFLSSVPMFAIVALSVIGSDPVGRNRMALIRIARREEENG